MDSQSGPRSRRVVAPGRRSIVGFCLLLLCVLVPLLGSAHRHTDAWAPRYSASEQVRFLPTGEFLRAASLGYEMLLADLLWVRATNLFGERHGTADKGWYSWLYHMVDITTDLDPEFRAAYKYGGTMLRVDGIFVDQSSLVFQKGMKHRPDEWYFPFGIAMNYFTHRDDRRVAARYMQIAAGVSTETGRGPFYLHSLAASLMEESGQLEAALRFATEERKNLPAGYEKVEKALDLKIFEIEYLLKVQEVSKSLEDFRREHRDLPENPMDLADAGYPLAEDPLGGFWVWDRGPEATYGSVTSSRYCEVFTELSREASLGRLSIQECQN